MAMMKKSTKPASASTAAATTTTVEPTPVPSDCPPDVGRTPAAPHGRLLHKHGRNIPRVPLPHQCRAVMKQFISTFSQLYPCGWCAEDFRSWMKEPGNEPKVQGQDELGMWMCNAHNAVNIKLGKPEFDCSLWKQRWRDGWKDGRCG